MNFYKISIRKRRAGMRPWISMRFVEGEPWEAAKEELGKRGVFSVTVDAISQHVYIRASRSD